MGDDLSMVMTTAPSQQAVDAIVARVLADKLAACIQALPITSHYVWQGETHHEPEFLLLMKMACADYAALEAAIRSVHPYETPEIIRTPIVDAFAPYAAWVMASRHRS